MGRQRAWDLLKDSLSLEKRQTIKNYFRLVLEHDCALK